VDNYKLRDNWSINSAHAVTFNMMKRSHSHRSICHCTANA